MGFRRVDGTTVSPIGQYVAVTVDGGEMQIPARMLALLPKSVREASGIYETEEEPVPEGQVAESFEEVFENGVVKIRPITVPIPIPSIDRAGWLTLLKGLPAAQRTALRNRIAARTDSDDDATFRAATYLEGQEGMTIAGVRAALVAVGIPLSTAADAALAARWTEVTS